MFILAGALILFWAVTLLNIFGIRVSSFVSSLSSVIGVILPTVILIIFAFFWVMDAKTTQITISWNDLLPDYSRWAFLTQIIIGLVGIESRRSTQGTSEMLEERFQEPWAFQRSLFY